MLVGKETLGFLLHFTLPFVQEEVNSRSLVFSTIAVHRISHLLWSPFLSKVANPVWNSPK